MNGDEVSATVRKRMEVWRHVATGKLVYILGHATLESDGTPLTVYCETGVESPNNRALPTSEFLDGRFVRVKDGET